MLQPKTKIVILKVRTNSSRRDLDLPPSKVSRLERRKKRSHLSTCVGSGNNIKRLQLRKSPDNDEDSSELVPSSGIEDSEEFSEYRPTTDSEYSSDDHHNAPNVINCKCT